MKSNLKANIRRTLLLIVSIFLAIKLAGPSLLRSYIHFGIGSCNTIPILCMSPQGIVNLKEDTEYIKDSLPYSFPEMTLYLPRGFSVVKERVTKVYYKRDRRPETISTIYLLDKPADFFINLYPQLKKRGVSDNYEFLRRTMYADEKKIKNLTDAFFVIMKSIFIPDLGNQKNVRMTEFLSPDKRGFLNYNVEQEERFFDCNIVDKDGVFYKIYIKDRRAKLDLDKVLAIISTLAGK